MLLWIHLDDLIMAVEMLDLSLEEDEVCVVVSRLKGLAILPGQGQVPFLLQHQNQ